jgi:glycosyltransferase involved in cell wall biosynthesis
MSGCEELRVAYLVSRYPAISHTFILREVLALRRLGLDLSVASINDPDRPLADLTAEERREAEGAYYVKRAGFAAAVNAHVRTLCRSPRAYFRALVFALRLGGARPRDLIFWMFYFVEAAMVGCWMRSRRTAHLHVHFATPAASVGLIVAKMFPATFSITVHGPDEFYDVTAHRLAQKISGCSFLCTIGQFARSQLMKLSPVSEWTKFEVTPLGVDGQVFSPRLRRPEADRFEILCVGRLTPAKGQHVLIAAAERLVSGGRRVLVRFVGDGPDRVSLENHVRSRALNGAVKFEGAVNQERIRDFYNTADVFVLPSFAEGIPVVLMEAMAMEIPCVATFVNGIPELIRDSVDGLLVAPSDEVALAGAIVQLMEDAGLRKRLGESARQRVLERYNLAGNTERLAEVFRRRLEAAA